MVSKVVGGACSAVGAVILWVWFGLSSLEPTEYGLEYDWWWESVRDNNGIAYSAGRYWLGLTKTFIRFPAMVETVQFSDEYGVSGLVLPPIWSRTVEGLAVELECSLQFQVMPTNVTSLYTVLGTFDQAQTYIVQLAKSVIMTEATHYGAHQFFANRTTIAPLIEAELREVFKNKLFAYLQFFQLQKIILPHEFEDAIKNTTLTTQHIGIVEAMRGRFAIEWETDLLKMQQHVAVRTNKAHGTATEIELAGKAAGQRVILSAEGDAAAIKVKGEAVAKATTIQREADADAVRAARRTEAGTIRLQSLTTFQSQNLSHYLQAASYGNMYRAIGSEDRFLEYMKVQALQNVSWTQMAVSLPKGTNPLEFMGLATN